MFQRSLISKRQHRILTVVHNNNSVHRRRVHLYRLIDQHVLSAHLIPPIVYWDMWEEMNAALADLKSKDPLEEWCSLEPWSDECRIYDV